MIIVESRVVWIRIHLHVGTISKIGEKWFEIMRTMYHKRIASTCTNTTTPTTYLPIHSPFEEKNSIKLKRFPNITHRKRP